MERCSAQVVMDAFEPFPSGGRLLQVLAFLHKDILRFMDSLEQPIAIP